MPLHTCAAASFVSGTSICYQGCLDCVPVVFNKGIYMSSEELRLPAELRELLLAHLNDLRERYRARGWGGRVGFGNRPALVVIDLAGMWFKADGQMGSDLDGVLAQTCRILESSRRCSIPIFFTTSGYDAATPPSPHDRKQELALPADEDTLFELHPRLERQSTEKLIRKPYASAFKGTNFHEMLASLGVDTLIVTGCSTSHCVYATCRDATDSFRVIVPREAVGERCELFHEVNLLDIDIDLGDVMPIDEVIACIEKCAGKPKKHM
jgi:nicotinamidase-related amidase